MATTITRESMTDGVTAWTVTRIHSAIYDRIDAVLAANIMFGGLVNAEGFGSHSFSAGGTGENAIAVRNTSSGGGDHAGFRVGNDSTASLAALFGFSSTYTSAGAYVASGVTLESTGSGGLQLHASHASGPLRLYTGGTLRLTIDSTGVSTFTNGINATNVTLQSADLNNNAGRIAQIGRNSNGSTPAAGALSLVSAGGTSYYLWIDATGDLRIHTSPPNDADTISDTAGTVVGTQS